MMISRENPSKSKNWKKSDEHLLEEWADHSKAYRWMHEQARLKFARKNAQFQIPVIIISTITGAANFAQDRVPADFQGHYSLIVGFMNIIAGVIATIQTFLKVSELLEGHRVASMSWGKYYHNVKTELQKEPEDRENVSDFMKYAKLEYEKLVEQSPPIPPPVINSFKERVDKSGVHVYLPPVMGVFDKFQIAENGRTLEREKTDVEKVLDDIDSGDEQERKLSRASNFLGNLSKKPRNDDDNNNNGFLSNKLMASLFPTSEAQSGYPIEHQVNSIVQNIVIDSEN